MSIARLILIVAMRAAIKAPIIIGISVDLKLFLFKANNSKRLEEANSFFKLFRIHTNMLYSIYLYRVSLSYYLNSRHILSLFPNSYFYFRKYNIDYAVYIFLDTRYIPKCLEQKLSYEGDSKNSIRTKRRHCVLTQLGINPYASFIRAEDTEALETPHVSERNTRSAATAAIIYWEISRQTNEANSRYPPVAG